MNSIGAAIAVASVALQGCVSYYALTQEEINKGMIPSESAIRVTRTDGSVIESGGFRHADVREPSDFVIGSGSERRSGKSFAGTVARSEIDSTHTVEVKDPDGLQQSYAIYWLKNATSLGFKEFDHLSITPELQPGLWCAGTVTDGDRSHPFKGMVDPLTIQKIEAKGFPLFHPSTPAGGDQAEPSFQWVNLGLGFASSSGGGAAAFLADYALLSRSSLYSVRLITTFTPPLPEARASGSLTEVAALHGLGVKSRFFTASVSAGISYVKESVRVPVQGSARYQTKEYSTVAFPFGLEFAVTPLKSFGASAKFFSSSNSRVSWTGFIVCLHFGV